SDVTRSLLQDTVTKLAIPAARVVAAPRQSGLMVTSCNVLRCCVHMVHGSGDPGGAASGGPRGDRATVRGPNATREGRPRGAPPRPPYHRSQAAPSRCAPGPLRPRGETRRFRPRPGQAGESWI